MGNGEGKLADGTIEGHPDLKWHEQLGLNVLDEVSINWMSADELSPLQKLPEIRGTAYRRKNKLEFNDSHEIKNISTYWQQEQR